MDTRVLVKGVCLALSGEISAALAAGATPLPDGALRALAAGAACATALAGFLDRGSAKLGRPDPPTIAQTVEQGLRETAASATRQAVGQAAGGAEPYVGALAERAAASTIGRMFGTEPRA